MNVDIEIVAAAARILSEESLSVSLINCTLELDLLIPKLTTNVDVGSLCSHTESDNKSTLNELVRVMPKDFSILASTRLGLISVDNEVRGATIGNLGHERVLESSGETGATTSTET